jgi:hypothetical protein
VNLVFPIGAKFYFLDDAEPWEFRETEETDLCRYRLYKGNGFIALTVSTIRELLQNGLMAMGETCACCGNTRPNYAPFPEKRVLVEDLKPGDRLQNGSVWFLVKSISEDGFVLIDDKGKREVVNSAIVAWMIHDFGGGGYRVLTPQ